MIEPDLFVALVAWTLGGTLIVASIRNDARCFEFRTPQKLSEMWGRTNARLILSSVGVIIVGLGCYLWLGRVTSANSNQVFPDQPASQAANASSLTQ